MTIDTKQLTRVADMLTADRDLMGSKWQNCEAAALVSQIIAACKNNLERHGDAFSWATYRMAWEASGIPIVGKKSTSDLLLVAYDGPLCRPDGVAVNEHGKPLVFRVTQELLDYCEAFCLRKQKSPIKPYPSALN